MYREYYVLALYLSNLFTFKELRSIVTFLNENNLSHINIEEINNYISIKNDRYLKLDDYMSRINWKHLREIYRLNENFISYFSDKYPERLRELSDFPIVIFFKGDINLLQTKCIGIVGSRNHSKYSSEALSDIIPSLIKSDITIVSGLAYGVDTLAHVNTLKNVGNTIAVIGTGIDLVYPPENCYLQSEIAKKGLVISEYPFNTPPRKFHFPQRNRIIAGVSHGLLVTEAGQKSGTLITASLAVQYNRNVYALPGRVNDKNSAGTNDLINDGATMILDPTVMIEETQYY